MLNAILGAKIDSGQRFTQDGQRIPVTRIKAGPCFAVQIKTKDKDGYNAVQLGWGEKALKKTKKPLQGRLRVAKLKKAPFFLAEVRLDQAAVEEIKPGESVEISQILKPGDEVKVTGHAKAKGFTGVMKRWGFAGGPKTHGQSDRQRAPGSIGQSTTIGRVFKGKKMPGRAGGQKVTVAGLTVMAIDEEKQLLFLKGLVPGRRGSHLLIKKTGKLAKFVPLMAVGEKEIKETEAQKEERLKREKEAQEDLAKAKEAQDAQS